MVSVIDVASYFVQKDGGKGSVTQLKLQKLCYYAQGFHLAIYQTPLFLEQIEAWQHGPVVIELRTPLSHKRRETIHLSDLPSAISISNKVTTSFLDKIWYRFGHYEGEDLINLTHAEDPWKEAYKVGRNTQISLLSMETYFTTRRTELMKHEISDLCEEDSFTVFLKDGKTAQVVDSELDNFIKENRHLIEPRKINTGHKRRTESDFKHEF